MAVAAPLKLISMLLKIKGRRQKRRERQIARQRGAEADFQARAKAMAAPAMAATLGGGAPSQGNPSPNAVTGEDYSAINPILGY